MNKKINLTAVRLRAVISMPEYQDTISAWIQEGINDAVNKMDIEDDQIKQAKARGQYRALRELQERIESVLARDEAETKRRIKKNMESYNE